MPHSSHPPKKSLCSGTALVVTWEDWCRLTLSRYQPAGRQGGLFVLLKCQWFTSLLSSNKGKPKQNDLGYNFHLRLWLASQAHRKFHIPSHPTILWTNNLPKPRSKLEWRSQESNNTIDKNGYSQEHPLFQNWVSVQIFIDSRQQLGRSKLPQICRILNMSSTS